MKTPTPTKAEVSAPNKRKSSDKSTATAAQIDKALNLLRIRQRNTYEFRQMGISHPAARVMDLVALGYVVTSNRITTVDSEGYVHSNVALYDLVAEPTLSEVQS